MVQTPEENVAARKKITTRLKRSRGQLDAVLRMMDEDKPCDDILMQLSAVKSSVDKAMKLVIAQNIRQNTDCKDSAQLAELQKSLDLMLKTK